MKCTTLCIAMLCLFRSYSQTKLWDGGGGSDNSWTNRFNWVGDIAPGSTDDILLDNSIISGSYFVTLPVNSVTVKRLTITPSGENTIRLVIPVASMATPAFTASGPGYGILINRGGIFQNSSGLASGTSLVIIADSMRISNGGRYIHNTRSVHANIIQVLSKAPGAENGTVEFDIPSGAGTLSMSNRTYGNLVLSSTAAGGARTYVASGSNSLTINGNMTINAGVTLSVDLSTANGNIIVKGDLIQNGGTLNLAAGAGNITALKVAGNITQAASGQITETSTGLPVVELNGVSIQNISLAGSITNDVSFIINNPAGVALLSPLSLPYKLILQRGQLSTSSASLLTLQANCMLQADSLSAGFVNGPLRKEGLSSASRFLFPVGRNNMHRWMELMNATGNFTVEYKRETPPYNYAAGPGIHHISGLEYWMILADASPAASAVVKLSFDANSGGITDLSKLLVTRLSGEVWTSLGNIITTGTAGTNGSVMSTIPVTDFSATGDLFTLATDAGYANPLPLKDPVLQQGKAAQRNVLFTKLVSVAPSIICGSTTLLTVLAEKEGPVRVVITNQVGQPVGMQQFFLSKGSNKLTLDASGLPFGIYQLTGYTATGATNTIRCIKQ